MTLIALHYLYLLILLIFIVKRTLIFAHFFQQEEYDNIRFFKNSIININLIDKKLSTTLIAIIILYIIAQNNIVIAISILALLFFTIKQKNPLSKANKKPLILTQRMKKILAPTFLLIILAIFTILLHVNNFIKLTSFSIIIIHLIPYALIISNVILLPHEKLLQNRLLNLAKNKIRSLKPIIIAITGSYGKTSTKHILNHILSFSKPTLCTPGSVNTPMGITRIIREKLSKDHIYFIVEMGAYKMGSIAKLCQLTPPDHSAITAIGSAHYERFKTIDNVARAKFEINDALDKDHKMCFINSDNIDDKYVKKYGKNIVKIGQNGDYKISDISLNKNGTEFSIIINNKKHKIKCPLYGKHHASNIAIAISIADKLGYDIDMIKTALKSTPQISHRLEVKKSNNSPIIIDDSYNSNPDGFMNALDILKLFKKDNNRLILVTPGMIELGDLHDKLHHEVGQKASKIIDYALIIKPDRVKEFISSLKASSLPNQRVIEFDDFNSAKKWLEENTDSDDVILYENDLPDLFENQIKF